MNDRIGCEAFDTAIKTLSIENIALKPVLPMITHPGHLDIVVQNMVSALQ